MSGELFNINELDSPLISGVQCKDRKLKGTASSLPDFTKHFREMPLEKPKPISLRDFRLIVPHSHFLKTFWDKSISALLAFSTIESLIYISYNEHNLAMNTIDIPVWCAFLVDFLLNFVTDYEDADGNTVQSYRLLAKRYARGWLVIDLVALCPLMFFGLSFYEHYFQLLRILKIQRSLALIDESWIFAAAMSLTRRPNIDQVVRIKTITKYTVLILKQLVIVLMFTFCTGAAFFWFSYHMRHHADKDFEDEFQEKSPGNLQKPLNSWYFAITTLVTIGYGDLKPANPDERVFVIFMILLGLGVFSALVGEFNGVVLEIDALRHNKYQQDELNEWLQDCESFSRRIPFHLRTRILAYYQHYWKHDRLGTLAVSWWTCTSPHNLTKSPDPLFTALPRKEKEMVLKLLFDDVFGRYDKFFLEEEGLCFHLALHLQPRLYWSKEVIIDEGEIPKEVVVLLSGVVICGIHSTSKFVNLLSFSKRGVFGDLQILTKSISPLCYRAHDYTKICAFAIPSTPYKLLLRKVHPKLEQSMLAFAWKRFEMAKRALIAYQSGVAVESIHQGSYSRIREWIAKEKSWEERCAELRTELKTLKQTRREMKDNYQKEKEMLLTEISEKMIKVTGMARKFLFKQG